jgi:3-oxoacyl-(acyl-carrier-protein) synthase
VDQGDMVIVGLGFASSLGCSAESVSSKLLRGRSGIRKRVLKRGSLPVLAALVPISTKQVSIKGWPMTRSTALGSIAATAALREAGLLESEPGSGLGIIHASARGNLHSLIEYENELQRFGLDHASPVGFPNTLLHATAGFLSMQFGADAFNITVANEASSSLDAIELASQLLKAGAARSVLCVAAEELSAELLALLKADDELEPDFPDPFGEHRRGYAPGEGAVACVVETQATAKQRRQRVLAFCRGYANASASSPERMSALLRSALADAGVTPAEIGCVMASGNGSLRDSMEAEAIAEVCGAEVPVTTVKGAFGECGTPSSLLSAAALLICSRRAVCPPTMGRSAYDPRLPQLNLVREPARMRTPFALVNAVNSDLVCAAQVLELA